jgi:uncharacterized protein (TIGR02588 family)
VVVEKNRLEWSVFAVSLVALASIFGLLGYDALTSANEQPDIAISLGTVEAHDGYYIVPLQLKNDGGQSVENVEVEVALTRDGQELESSSVSVAELPRQSSRRAWVAFSINPDAAAALDARVVSYVVP